MDLTNFPPPGVLLVAGTILVFLGIFLIAREPRKPGRWRNESNRTLIVPLVVLAIGSASLAAEFVIDVARLPPPGSTILFRYSVSVEPSTSAPILLRLPAPVDEKTWDRMHATNGTSSLSLSGNGENLTVEILATQAASFEISFVLRSSTVNASLTRLRYVWPSASGPYNASIELIGNGTGTAAARVHLHVSFEAQCYGRIYDLDQLVEEGLREYPTASLEYVC
jgi:hypothetical protein